MAETKTKTGSGGFGLPHMHGEKNAEHLHAELTKTAQFSAASEIFRQLGDPSRVKLFWLLCHHEECVINIAALMEMSSPAVSHHLRSLYDCGLLTSRRDGKEVYYRAADTEAARLLHVVVEQIMEIACPEKEIDLSGSTDEVVRGGHDYMV
jgi:DNA-binding transcriptional ArsR family regulator